MAGSFWVILLTNLANSSLCGRQRATHAPAGILTKPRARNQFPAVSTSNRLVSCSAPRRRATSGARRSLWTARWLRTARLIEDTASRECRRPSTDLRRMFWLLVVDPVPFQSDSRVPWLGLFRATAAKDEIVREEHQREDAAKSAHNGRAGRQVQENGKVNSQGRNQRSHRPPDGQPPADPVGKQHGAHRGDDQVAENKQDSRDGHRGGDDKAE